MRRTPELRRSGVWAASAEVATVTLPCADRHRRRILMRDDAGGDFLLDLPEATQLRDGDGLVLEDGTIIRVIAAEEAVADITCGDAIHLTRVAWHLGNRHTPVQVLPDGRLRIAHDHVLESMVEGLGATVERARAPFQPEGGAYGGHGASHGHDHHGHGHSHDHGHGSHVH